MISRKLSLQELSTQENIPLSNEIVAANNVVIVPKRIDGKDRLNSDFLALIKEIRLQAKTSYIASRNGESEYYDFRGGESELPLFILKDVVLPIVLGIIANRLDQMLSDYQKSKKENPSNVKLQEPVTKVRWYLTESLEYFELETPVGEAYKTITAYLQARKKDR